MKTKISLVIAIVVLLGTEVFATIHTVSNDNNRPAQYPDIPQAVAAANAGDTIYVNGTQYLYSDFTINKKLVMIGAGYNSSNQFNLITQVNNISFFKDSGVQDGSGSVITGFKINGSIGMAGGTLVITNIRFFRNMINSVNPSPWTAFGTSNWIFYNNIFTARIDCSNGYTGGGCTNFVIQNNIFTQNAYVSNFGQSSIVIDHNLFVHGNAFAGLQFATITNNIITSSDNTQVMNNGVTNCTFNSNLSLSQNIANGSNSFLAQSNTGGSNIVGSDPLFISCSDFNNYNGGFNYRLTSGSPGHNAGTDGTDIGIYGGSYPFPSGGAPGSGYDMSAFPPIPQITNMNIQNASVLPGAQLKVSVQATINN
jgi:hypothetical protein